MPNITLPDGSVRSFDHPVTVAEVAASIGAGLAKAALAGRVGGRLVDLSHLLDTDADLAILTDKAEEGLEIVRHSTAHLLAHAVKELFPDAQVTIGPVIENGFYYDFSYKRPFTPEDLAAIEARMAEIAKREIPVQREVWPRDKAVDFFKGIGEHYKAEIIASIPAGEDVSLYRQGDFIDLCRGPHVPSTGKLKVFKLMKLAGAYWRGDSKNEMLQRVYGTAWIKKDELDAYLHMIEEAEKRDHRKLGRLLDLFHIQDEAPGMVFWHAKGWTLWQQVEQYLRRTIGEHGYQEVKTPQIVDRSLWEKSGHWGMYSDLMFTTQSEKRDYAVKPMNCPCHIQIFNQGLKSYRDLPLRMAEFGSCHRNEPSGSLHGLMRVRGFTQDDAHIFCTEEQIMEEVSACIRMVYDVYGTFGFENIVVKLSTRPEQRIGSDEAWDRAEAALAEALELNGLKYDLQPGEGAFYGPKIEFTLHDCLDRAWQCGTVQLDFALPGRLGATYVGEDNERHIPVMIHRAILGSLERFIGILTEEYAGLFPTWLAPTQAVVMNITDNQADYAVKVAKALNDAGLRAKADLRNEKIGFKIREHTLKRVPFMLVCGDKEVEAGKIAVRTRKGADLGSYPVEELIALLTQEVQTRGQKKVEE